MNSSVENVSVVILWTYGIVFAATALISTASLLSKRVVEDDHQRKRLFQVLIVAVALSGVPFAAKCLQSVVVAVRQPNASGLLNVKLEKSVAAAKEFKVLKFTRIKINEGESAPRLLDSKIQVTTSGQYLFHARANPPGDFTMIIWAKHAAGGDAIDLTRSDSGICTIVFPLQVNDVAWVEIVPKDNKLELDTEQTSFECYLLSRNP